MEQDVFSHKWAIDIDGVITANPSALSWFTYHLSKNENTDFIIILTWRDGSDSVRREQTIEELKQFGIHYDHLEMAPRKFENLRSAALWKIHRIKELNVDIWIDDELKEYKRDLGIDVNGLLPQVHKIWI